MFNLMSRMNSPESDSLASAASYAESLARGQKPLLCAKESNGKTETLAIISAVRFRRSSITQFFTHSNERLSNSYIQWQWCDPKHPNSR